MVQGARSAVSLWHRQVVAAQNIVGDEEELMHCDDMLADAEDWLHACNWVFLEAQAELGAGQLGRAP
eukprot:SAG11_NODE_9966_length_865_cov_4.862924_2_plen_67_part_00